MPMYRFRTMIDDDETLYSTHGLPNDFAAWAYACRLMSEVMSETGAAHGAPRTCHCNVSNDAGRHLMELHFDGIAHAEAGLLGTLDRLANGTGLPPP